MNLTNKSIGILSAYSVYAILVSFITWLRPIHQDDGWYASFAFSLVNKLLGRSVYSEWSYALEGFPSAGTGFLYSVYQLPFILIFGTDVLYTKILVVATTLLALYLIVRFLEIYFPRGGIYFPLLLILWPGFWYHFYNRPEMLALALGFFGLYNLASANNKSPVWVAFSFCLPFLMFDIHPISVFLVFGYYIWYLLSHRTMIPAALIGGVVGISIYLAGNWIVHGSLGAMSFFVGVSVSRGDHYIPIFESGWADILNIAVKRYKIFLLVICFSLLWVPLVIYRNKLKMFFIGEKLPLIITLLGFFVLSSLFTEAVSNGFQLYSTIAFFLLVMLLLSFVVEQLGQHRILQHVFILPLLSVLLYVNYRSAPTHAKYFSYAKSFYSDYPRTVGECIPKSSRGLMRPTYAFATASHRGSYEYTFNLLFYMKSKNLGFGEGIMSKDYDFIAIDAMDKGDMFFEQEVWGGNNWFYRAISGTRASDAEFNMLIDKGALVPMCSFDEISHGKTQFYRIDKAVLRNLIDRKTNH